MTIDPSSRVGELASLVSGAAEVFTTVGIRFGCEGSRTLEDVCADRGLDVADVIAALELASAGQSDDLVGWHARPLADLIAHVVTVYHAGLDRDLVRLEASTRHLAALCGEDEPRIVELAATTARFASELREHMAKEERILFPWVLSGNGANAGAPVRVMLFEHRSASHMLTAIRTLVAETPVPHSAPATWSALEADLGRFDRTLERHVHLENNVLFPRALAGETA